MALHVLHFFARPARSKEKTKAPAEAGAPFGAYGSHAGERGAQRPARCSKVKFSFVAKVRGIDANTLESARRSHGKFSSLAFLH